MDYNELINDFLEGNLEGAKEDELILQLSTNDDFRSEFKKYIAIDKSLRTDAANLVPSTKATMGVFSQLGFSTAPGMLVQKPFWLTLGSFFGRYSQGMVGGLIAAALTALLFLMFYPTQDIDGLSKSPQLAIVGTDNNVIQDAVQGDKVPLIKSLPSDEIPVRSVNRLRNTANVALEETAVNVADNSSQVLPEPLINDANLNAKMIIPEKHLYLPARTIVLQNNEMKPLSFTGNEIVLVANQEEKIGLSLQLFGNSYVSLLKTDVDYKSRPRFSNSGLGISYRLDENFTLLADLRQEYIYQRFEGYDAEGYKVIYSQIPNFLSFGAGVRYDITEFDRLKIYGNALAGGNQYGLMGRMMLGMDWYISSDYKFIIGVEGSIFRYLHNEDPFHSYKIGLTYGIGFDL